MTIFRMILAAGAALTCGALVESAKVDVTRVESVPAQQQGQTTYVSTLLPR